VTWFDTLESTKQAQGIALLNNTPAGREALQKANGDHAFALFLAAADWHARKRLGLSIWDLADYTWRDAFDDELTPIEALRRRPGQRRHLVQWVSCLWQGTHSGQRTHRPHAPEKP
jgi:hypothetical protein